MKPNVLFVSINFFSPEYLDGANKITYNLLKEKSLYQGSFLSLFGGSLKKEQEKDFSHIKIVTLQKKVRKIDNVYRAIRWLFGTSLGSLSNSNSKLLSETIENQANHFDCIYLCSLGLANVLEFLSNNTKKKIILGAIDSYSLFLEGRIRNENNWLKKKLLERELRFAKKFEENAYRNSPKTIFVSSIDLNHSKKEFPEGDFHTISLGVDTNFFHPSKDLSSVVPNQIIFTGNLSYAPNKDACLFLVNEVLPLLEHKIPDVKLILAGSNPPEEIVRKNKQNIQITGRVEDLRPYVWNSSLFVCPLRFGAGMKNKVLEVLSMEKTSILSTHSLDGIEGVKENLYLLKTNATANEWAEAIVDVISRSSENFKSLQKTRKIIEKSYSWESRRKAYNELFLASAPSFSETK